MKIKKIDKHKDCQTIAELHIAGLQSSYGGQVDSTYLEGLNQENQAQKWDEWLNNPDTDGFCAYEGNNPVGFVVCGRIRTPPPGQSAIRPLYSSEILGIYVLEEYWKKGVGTELLKQAVVLLKDIKHTSLCLWVLDTNKRACAFYESLGGQRVGKQKVEIGNRWVKEICYGWRDTSVIMSL